MSHDEEDEVDSEMQWQNNPVEQSQERPESKLTEHFKLTPIEDLFLDHQKMRDSYGDDLVFP